MQIIGHDYPRFSRILSAGIESALLMNMWS